MLQPLTPAEAQRLRRGERRGDWAEAYPTESDLTIAGIAAESEGADDGRLGPWQVVDRQDGKVVGGVGFFGGPRRDAVALGYTVAADHRHRGLATAAVEAALAVARTSGEIRHVVAETHLDNVASQRVLEKAGFVVHSREGARIVYEFDLHPAVR